MKVVKRTWILTLLTLSGVVSTTQVIAEGIGGSGVVSGETERFGSIVIGGVHYDTEQASIRINGEAGYEHDLKVGYQVVIRGDIEAGLADEVEYFDAVAGPLESVSVDDDVLGSAELMVMGQRVVTDAGTWFHDSELSELNVGQNVIVSGVILPDGAIRASSLERRARHLQVVTGVVVDSDDEEFTIGTLRIDADDVDDDDGGLEGDDVRDGQRVHVIGYYQGDGVFHAIRIHSLLDTGDSAQPALIQGPLSLDSGQWMLQGRSLEISDQTSYLTGKSEDLEPGVQVSVRGNLGADGTLRALEMEVERGALSRLEGNLEEVDQQSGTITVNGMVVEFDEQISMIDGRDGYRWYAPDDISAHDQVSLVVKEVDGRIRVDKLERKRTLRRVMKSSLENTGWAFAGLSSLRQQIEGLESASEASIDGLRVSVRMLKWFVRDGDEVQVEWDDEGEVERVVVTTRFSSH